MSNVGEMLNAYKEANGVSRVSIADAIGLPQRRVRSIMSEGRTPTEMEEHVIMKWLEKEHFDYVPPEAVSTTTVKTKDAKRKVLKETDAVGIKGDAKALVRAYKEANGFKTDTDALTHIVNSFFMNLLKEAE